MAWVCEVHAEGEWVPNCQYFATKEEAENAGAELLQRWFVPDDFRAVEVEKTVNYKFENGRAVRLETQNVT